MHDLPFILVNAFSESMLYVLATGVGGLDCSKSM